MPHFKDAQNAIYWLDDGDIEQWKKPDWVEITDADAEVIRKANEPQPTVKDLLAKLDAENALTQRNLRETILLMAEAFKVVSNNAVDLSAIPGVAKVAEVEAQAAALRAQL